MSEAYRRNMEEPPMTDLEEPIEPWRAPPPVVAQVSEPVLSRPPTEQAPQVILAPGADSKT
jgi:hypothetical protein